ncbi:MAG TPA: trypsin-like peptidase domain-containing protein [Gemmatimonadales bacterium]|nr:trypsin-like peptidase domain-containing protein [Gemmatimonadales bacterium]
MLSGAFLGDAAARLRASVVAIVDPAGRSRRGQGAGRGGHGAGFAWGADLFVTSAHVVSERTATVVTPDGRAVEGTVVGRDVDRDIAVVRAIRARVPSVSAGDPYALRPGSLVFAVGHPLGVTHAVSVGVFQAVRAVPPGYGLAGSPVIPWVQADVRLAPGNSGGPIADVEGNVIGVAAMIVSGLALAVPAPDVERLLSSLG